MIERSTFDRVVAATRYLVLGTVDPTGDPWVSPVFFAGVGPDRVYWVSSPHSRHSLNIAHRPTIALTWFDTSVEVGRAEAAYATGEATTAASPEADDAVTALNARLPSDKQLTDDDLWPHGPLAVYRAELQHCYILVRGGNRDLRNAVDVTVQV